jgi:MYXO-CTERM domain-containing protein
MNPTPNFRPHRLAAALAALACALPAAAAELPANTWQELDGTSAALETQLLGTVIDSMVQPFQGESSLGGVHGALHSWVVRSHEDQTLDFYWRLVNSPSSAAPLFTHRIINFEMPSVEPFWRGDFRADSTGDVRPSHVQLVDIPGPDPDVQFFQFYARDGANTDGVLPGQTSKTYFFDTLATSYGLTSRHVIYNLNDNFDFVGNELRGFAPSAPVPEPGTWTLAVLGLAGLWMRQRRR